MIFLPLSHTVLLNFGRLNSAADVPKLTCNVLSGTKNCCMDLSVAEGNKCVL